MNRIKMPDCIRCDHLETEEKWTCKVKGKIPGRVYEGKGCREYNKLAKTKRDSKE